MVFSKRWKKFLWPIFLCLVQGVVSGAGFGTRGVIPVYGYSLYPHSE
jgi:hypothetical protein